MTADDAAAYARGRVELNCTRIEGAVGYFLAQKACDRWIIGVLDKVAFSRYQSSAADYVSTRVRPSVNILHPHSITRRTIPYQKRAIVTAMPHKCYDERRSLCYASNAQVIS